MTKIRRVGAPTRTTKGAVGDTYIDLKARKAYICTSAYRDSTGSVDYAWREKEEEVVDDVEEVMETPVETPVETPKTFEAPVIEEVTGDAVKTEPVKPQNSNPNQKRNYSQYHKR